jgi:perosamine synthetase
MQEFERLETQFAEWIGVVPSQVVVCSSGTAALHLAMEVLELPKQSQVIVPEFTMIACARAVSMAGMRPVFVDCNDDLLIAATQIPSAMTPLTSAIMPVHVYGRCCDMPRIVSLGLPIIEDMAEAPRCGPHTKTDAACWSFYQNKIVAGEEGGATYFRDPERATIAREIRCQGFGLAHNFLHRPYGVNCRLSNANAELILKSLKHAAEHMRIRKEIADMYDEYLPRDMRMPSRMSVWVYDLLIPEGLYADILVGHLNKAGIPARMAFKPMSQQAEYRGHYRHLNAYRLSRRVIYLPVYPDMRKKDVKANVERLLEFCSL